MSIMFYVTFVIACHKGHVIIMDMAVYDFWLPKVYKRQVPAGNE